MGNKVVRISIEDLWQISDKFPTLFNVPCSPFSREGTPVFHEMHKVLRKVLHRLCGGIRADMPVWAVGANCSPAVVRAVKGLPELTVGDQIMMVMRKGMRPFMAEQLAQGAPLIKAKLGEDSGAGHGRNVDVTGGTVVLPAKAVCGKGPEPNLHLGHGIAPQAKIPQFTQHMLVSSV